MASQSGSPGPMTGLFIRLYRMALGTLPRWFRREWGRDMYTTFVDRLREARKRGGTVAVAAVGTKEIGSVTLAAFQSRVEQATGRIHRAREAQDGSDVGRTDPLPALFHDHGGDRRRFKVAWVGALACHFALFLIVFPELGSTELLVEPPEVTVIHRYEPPKPPDEPIKPERVRRVVDPLPIPDPTPDDPEPIYEAVIEYQPHIEVPNDPEFSVGLPPAPPTPRGRDRVRAGVEVEPPNRIHYVQPVYPELAIRARLECTVILEAVIDRQGNVIDTKVLRGCGLGLHEAALLAVSQWHYTPTLLNGRPVEVVATVTVVFKLARTSQRVASRASARVCEDKARADSGAEAYLTVRRAPEASATQSSRAIALA